MFDWTRGLASWCQPHTWWASHATGVPGPWAARWKLGPQAATRLLRISPWSALNKRRNAGQPGNRWCQQENCFLVYVTSKINLKKPGNCTTCPLPSRLETQTTTEMKTCAIVVNVPSDSTRYYPPLWSRNNSWGFPGGAVVENLPANAGDTGSSPGLGRAYMPRSN